MVGSGRWREHTTEDDGGGLRVRGVLELGDRVTYDPTYGFAKRAWDVRPRRLPGAEVRLDAVGSGDGLAIVDERECTSDPTPSELTFVDEAVGVGLPGVGE